ncbi:protein PAXX isoform X2 [Leucoraja erinacea]|nr:protein PAXX isoform X2 [Leucoraja erinacea]
MDNQEVPASIRSLHIHRHPQNNQRYFCYTRVSPGAFDLCVTNIVDVWSTAFSQQKLEEHKSMHGMKNAEEYHTRTKEAFHKDAVSLTVLDNTMILKLSQDALGLAFDLYKLPVAEAKVELRSVVFHLVDHVHQLEKQVTAMEEADASSPGKRMPFAHRLFQTVDFDSKMKSNDPGSSPVARKRLAGESLINPGRKRTKAPTGVSFEDNNLDNNSQQNELDEV